jgi:methionine synthase II (cobalamin-independent)
VSSAPVVPWPAGSATGVGSLPGTSIRDAVRLVVDELPDFVHLPELPARGPWADMTGRALALLPDFPAEWGPTGWALADRPGRETRRSMAVLGEDLDALEELAEGWSGPLKVQLCGPWTLAATIELRSGRKVLADRGATRDLHQAYTDALAGHAAEVARRLPAARLVVQLDEPALPHVLEGAVPTPSGLSRLAAVDQQVVEGVLRSAAEAATGASEAETGAMVGVHCCAASPPLRLLRGSGVGFVSLDVTLLTEADDDPIGEALEAGLGLLLGVVPAVEGRPSDPPGRHDAEELAAPVRLLWRRLGQPVEQISSVVVTPTCGLAGSSPDYARAALVRCREVARRLCEDPEAPGG